MSLKLHSRLNCDETRLNYLLTTNRKFREVELKGKLSAIGQNRSMEILRRHGLLVATLSLEYVYLDSIAEFAEILKCMPNLRQLIILKTTVTSTADVPAEEHLPELTKLKTLQMSASDYSILKCLKTAKLTTIKILHSKSNHSMDCKDLEAFLKSQDKLTTLAIRSIFYNKSMLFRTTNLSTSMPFQLTRLSLLYIHLEDDLQSAPNNYKNLLKFLEPQAKTLMELELGHRFPGFVYQFVFAKMTNLKTLNVMMGQIPKQKEFFERLVVNRSINNLILKESPRRGSNSAQFYRDFLKCLPNVTSLTVMNECSQEIFEVIAQTMKKLETLRVSYGTGFDGVKFANLNSLLIEHEIEENFDWNQFTKANSRLAELTVGNDASSLNVNDIESITRNTNLHRLTLGEGFEANKRFMEIIRKNCPDLKKLELPESCGLSNEQIYQSDLVGVLRFCRCDFEFQEYPVQHSEFWSGFLYEDVSEWDVEEADLVDPFDGLMWDGNVNVDVDEHTDDERFDEESFDSTDYEMDDFEYSHNFDRH